MIPKFNKKGNLPHGVHIATIDEVIERYRWRNNSARIRRSDALLSFYNFVSSFALDLYINGSYITTKLSPGDVDLALVLSNDFKLQSTEGIRLLGILNQPKSDLHIFPYKGRSDLDLIKMVSFWMKDRDNNAKGIICIRIKNNDKE